MMDTVGFIAGLIVWSLVLVFTLSMGIIGIIRTRSNWKWTLLMLGSAIICLAACTALVLFGRYFVLTYTNPNAATLVHRMWKESITLWQIVVFLLILLVFIGGLRAYLYGLRRCLMNVSLETSKNSIYSFFKSIFGTFSWTPPKWILEVFGKESASHRFLKEYGGRLRDPHVKKGAAAIIFILIIGGLIYFLWPKPPELITLTANVTSPLPPPPRKSSDPVPAPQSVYIRFSGSAAPLESIGKIVSTGVTLLPPQKGEWHWDSDSVLRFIPQDHWPIGQIYRIRIEKDVLASHVRLITYELSFSTVSFSANIDHVEFYQDPVDPHVKKVVATVKFNYPVEAKSFEQGVKMVLVDPKARSEKPFPYTVTYDDLKFEAYVHSDLITIPLEDQTMRFVMEKGVVAQGGGEGTPTEGSQTVLIPGRYNLFRIQDGMITIVRDERYEPDQVLVINCSAGVLESTLARNISAYLLPVDKPAVQGQKAVKNYYWGDTRVIGPEIIALSKPLELVSIPAEHEYSQQHTFKINAEPNRFVYVKINKGIEAYGGYILAKDADMILRAPQYPREVQIMHEGAILSVSGERRLNILARGIPAVRIELDRILPKDLNHLLSQSAGDFKSPYFQNYLFNESNISEVFSEVRTLDASNPRKAQYTAVDFSPYLHTGDATNRGVFILKVQAWDPEKNQPKLLDDGPQYHVVQPQSNPAEGGEGEENENYEEREEQYSQRGRRTEQSYNQAGDRRFILVTDLGIIAKTDAEQNNLIFVQSIKTGEPVVNAVVEVLGKNSMPVLSRRTDQSGLASFPTLKDFTAEKQPVAFVVRQGTDLSFLPLNRGDRALNFSRFDVGGVRTQGQADALSAFLFSDRGLYRPGDVFHIGMLVKPVDWAHPVAGIPVQVVITDPRGLEIKKFVLTLSKSGFVEISYATEESSPTGTYNVSAFIVQNDRRKILLGSTTIRIEEFLPDRLRISVRFVDAPAEGWIAPDHLKARVDLSNLFGTPAAGHRVSATMTLKPRFPAFKGYRDYTFFDPLRAENSYDNRLPDQTTDDKGSAPFDLNLTNIARATYQLEFFAQGYELDGGRGVSSEISTIVSPLSYIIGYKSDSDLSYVKKGSEHYVKFIAIDSTLKKIMADKLTAVLIEQHYVSVLARQKNGTFKYQSVLKDTTRDRSAFTIDASGTRYRLPTNDAGDFVLSIRDANDTELNKVRYSVAGAANLSRQLERNAELGVTLDRKDYEPGGTIELQIKAPYVGSGLITIERDRVYAHKWFKTTTTASVQRITLPPGLEGNGYVNVEFVRSLDSDEIFMSPLSYGVVPFSVNRNQRTINITLETPDSARPGRPFTINYMTDRPSNIVVYAVDEGILQVANYQTPDPLAYFLSKRALEVTTRQILDLLLPEYSIVRALSGQGGDQELAALAKNLNPFKRKREKPVVFWSGIIEAGEQRRTLTYTIPDYFNGTLRVMAVAVSSNAMGTTSKKSTIRGPFVISPNTPLFVAPNDTFEASAAIANNVEGSGKEAKIQVTLTTAGGLEIQGNPRREVIIPEGREGVVRFNVKANAGLGNAELRFVSEGGGEKVTATATMSVRPPIPYVTTIKSGSVINSSVDVEIDRSLYPHHARLEVAVSPLPLTLARSLAVFLENYPYYCTEQLVSATVPALVLSAYPELGYGSKRSKEALDRTLTILQARQNSEGAFGFWAANSHASDFQTIYAMHILTEANDRGYVVPGEMFSKGLGYLRVVARNPIKDLSTARLRAYAIYVLARNGQLSTSELADLVQVLKRDYSKSYPKDIVAVYLAGVYHLMRDSDEANKAIKTAELADTVVLDEVTFYDTQAYLAQYLYIVAKHFPELLGDVQAAVIARIAKGITDQRYNTLSSAISILALDAYAKSTAQGGEKDIFKGVTLSEMRDNKNEAPIKIGSGLFPLQKFSHNAKALRIANKSPLPLFYAVTMAGFDLEAPRVTVKKGLEIIHSYEDDAGNPVTDAKLGAMVFVHIKVRALDRGSISNIAIVDLLPAGFDVVFAGDNQSGITGRLESSKSTWHPEYADIREDRVVLYGTVTEKVGDFIYKIRATARGGFQVPPTFVEAMYDRTMQGISLGGRINVSGE